MTRTSHKAHPTPSFPVYCLDWADDETLILGGGGGASRSGIANALKLAKVSKDGRSVNYINELKLSNEEDAPMTLAVDRKAKQLITGINGSQASIQGGSNDHVRTYTYGDSKLEYSRGVKTIDAPWSDDYPYQKLTALSPSTTLLAIGITDDRFSILDYPSMATLVSNVELDGELVDLHWGGESGEWLAVTTSNALLVYHYISGEKSRLELKQTIFPPSIDITPVAFRSARFSPTRTTPPTIHAVLNATKSAKRGAPRKAFVANFEMVAGPSKTGMTKEEKASTVQGKGKEKDVGGGDGDELGRWDVVLRREVGGKPVTVFDVSADGNLLSFGCSDLSIGILDAKTLAPLLKILHAHSFPPTALKFNPSANLLVSASADNTIRAIVVPPSFSGVSTALLAFILAIIAIIVALYLRR